MFYAAKPGVPSCSPRKAWLILADIFHEARPPVQGVFLLRFAATSAVITHPALQPVLAALGWLLTTTASYILNGISDLDGDRMNGSHRPLASGRLGTTSASACVFLASAGGLVLCFIANRQCGWFALCMAILGASYSIGPRLKESATFASMVIGLGAGLTYLAGWSVRGNVTSGDIVLGSALSCWVCAACATKDFSDVDGDQLAGRRTFPTMFGLNRAARIVGATTAGASVIVVVVSAVERLDLPAAVVVLVGTAAFPLACRRAAAASTRSKRRVAYRLYMFIQYAMNGSMLLLGAR